jgi:hypothetical protein
MNNDHFSEKSNTIEDTLVDWIIIEDITCKYCNYGAKGFMNEPVEIFIHTSTGKGSVILIDQDFINNKIITVNTINFLIYHLIGHIKNK